MIKNRFKRTSILCLTLLIFSFLNLTKVHALSSQEMMTDTIKWGAITEKTNISNDKEWKIKFNKSIDSTTAIGKNIYVMDENENLVSTSIKLNSDNTEIQVIPSRKYVDGKKYTLYIKDLKAKDGSLLNNNVKMPFSIVQNTIIEVKNTKELLENIGPNRTLILKAGDYNLLAPLVLNNKYIRYGEVFDGMELIIRNLDNLTIKGEEGAKVQLLVEPRYATVLNFSNCNNINIENIIAGHYPDEGYCTGGVLYFDSSKNINVNNSELFGCGTMGVTLYDVENFFFNNSIIKECSYGIMDINESKNVKFNDSNFYDCREYDLIQIYDSGSVEFNRCNIYNNMINYDYDTGYALFQVDLYSKVIVNGGSIKNNCVKDLVNDEDKDRVIFNNVDIKNNTILK